MPANICNCNHSHLEKPPYILQSCWQTSHSYSLQSQVQAPRHHMRQSQAKSFLHVPSKTVDAGAHPVPRSRTSLHSASSERLPSKSRRSWVLVRLLPC
jgi:hypothetical protein